MERRTLGRTGERLSVVGFGGIVVMRETAEDAARFVAEAVDRGINYFDVAPTYGDAEERLGPALEPFRGDVFLACKTIKRDATSARDELEQSLRRLRTDHVDLYQLHGIATEEEVDRVLAPGGALEAFVEARRKGQVRYLGFSAHAEAPACRLLEAFDFDTVMFPVNFVTWLAGGFGPRIMESAHATDTAVLALKALARTEREDRRSRTTWPKCWYHPIDDAEEASLALRFTLSRPVTAAVSPSHAELLWLMCDAAADLRPPSAEELHRLDTLAAARTPIFRTETP